MGKKNVLVVLLTAVVVGGGAFWGGIKYNQGQAVNLSGGRMGAVEGASDRQTRFGEQDRGQSAMLSGEIIASDEDSVTLKLRDGGSKVIFLSTETKITKSVEGEKTDLTDGVSVSIFGQEDQKGNYSASSIQLFLGEENFRPGMINREDMSGEDNPRS